MIPFFPLGIRERAVFARNLSVFIRSGVALPEAFILLIEEARSRKMKSILTEALRLIQGGTSVGKSLQAHRGAFGDVFIHMVVAGEMSGTLEENLSFLADLLEQNAELRDKIRLALLYPEIVLVSAAFLAFGLSFFILPRLIPLFTNLGFVLPWPTRALLAFTMFLQTRWQLALLGIIAFFGFAGISGYIPQTRRGYYRAFIHLPFLGMFMRDYQLALIARVSHTFLKGGLSISEMMRGGVDVATNDIYKDALRRAGARIQSGTPLAEAFAEHPELFPKDFIIVIAVGEKSGTLEQSFLHLAQTYQRAVDERAKKLPVIFEPLLLIGVGLFVGFVALSIILPIYQFTQTFRP